MWLLVPLLLVAAALTPLGAWASADCGQTTVKNCEIRKATRCGPIQLESWLDDEGVRHCERGMLPLSHSEVIPALRRVRCLLVGDDTQVRFVAENYSASQGPSDGDIIALENGSAIVVLAGQYDTASRESQVYFENMGPGRMVLLKCAGFGPG